MACRATGSTLSPYTTLFRSREPHHRVVSREIEVPVVDGDACAARFGESLTDVSPPVAVRVPQRDDAARRIGLIAERQDRKSTRLNSSHPVISYAVFALKKKT